MATITKETGAASSGATSYVSEADFSTYNTERNITLTADNGSASEVLIKAMDYLESKMFIGDKYTDAQALQWPRSSAIIDGYYIAVDTIPLLLREAQMEVAVSIDAGTNPLANQGRETISESVGPISVQYKPSSLAADYLTAAETKLRKLVRLNSRAFRV